MERIDWGLAVLNSYYFSWFNSSCKSTVNELLNSLFSSRLNLMLNNNSYSHPSWLDNNPFPVLCELHDCFYVVTFVNVVEKSTHMLIWSVDLRNISASARHSASWKLLWDFKDNGATFVLWILAFSYLWETSCNGGTPLCLVLTEKLWMDTVQRHFFCHIFLVVGEYEIGKPLARYSRHSPGLFLDITWENNAHLFQFS
jgi:hypothetical protein